MQVRLLLCAVVVSSFLSTAAAGASTTTTVRGQISGAKYVILMPETPGAKVVLLAHGLRREELPLTAEVAADQPFIQALLGNGWIVASTSYRRNGWIIGDAIDDLRALRSEVPKLSGREVTQTILIGESMGGMIAAKAVEIEPKLCDGALALGAAIREPQRELLFSPKVPILFLCNTDETVGPKAYVTKVAADHRNSALWTVSREGHVNFNDDELEKAFYGLVEFIRNGRIEDGKDVTVDVRRKNSELKIIGNKAICHIVGIHPVFGNLISNVIQADLTSFGIAPGTQFIASFSGRDIKVRYVEPNLGTKGEWIAYVLSHDGLLRIVCVGQNTGRLLNVSKGDEFKISNPR